MLVRDEHLSYVLFCAQDAIDLLIRKQPQGLLVLQRLDVSVFGPLSEAVLGKETTT